MVMAERHEVDTASVPVTAIDAVALAGEVLVALARVPFRRPLAGPGSTATNLGVTVTREVLRSFMGNVTGLPIAEFRSVEHLIDDLCGVVLPPVVRASGVDQRPLVLGGVPGLVYAPKGAPPRGVIVYLHGGGFIGTSPRMYAVFVARLCRVTGCAVFVADYRLAPEFPFPAAIHDAADVLVALCERGAPPERLFLAGDSAGGGLVNSLLLAPRDMTMSVRPAGLLLFSPEVDLHLQESSIRENEPYDILPWNVPTAAYLNGEDPSRSYFDHHEADLSRFPPTFVSWGADEMFRDAIRRFVERLDESGVSYEGHEAPGMFHVFPIVMPWAEESRQAFRQVARFVTEVLAGAPPLPAAATTA